MTKSCDVIHTETGAKIGGISEKMSGWFFVSFISSHKGSRTGHATAEKAFPKWAKKDSKMIERIAK